MPGGAWPKYPPCASSTCTNGVCCARGNFLQPWKTIATISRLHSFVVFTSVAKTMQCFNHILFLSGHKFRWPELLGQDGQKAKATIERDNPLVTVVVLPPGRVGFGDYCCNRVYLLIDKNGKVFQIPYVGWDI